jgi:DNA-directed RNA polymerase subunit alpha
MENIPLPNKIEIKAGDKENESIISIQPCHPGYGTTIGNALRRVLLSSLPGAAVTSFKIKGVNHEFSAIPNVLEDVVEISLNLKKLRLKIFSEEPVRLKLRANGEKKVTAKDIEKNSDVEIINGDLLIATLTDKSADLEIELIVKQGRGYIPTESREKEDLETGMIAIDSIYTPVKNVGFKIENVRIGQITNYENLVLSVETDGTISPKEALAEANKLLIEHFNFIAENNVIEVETKKKPAKKEKEEVDEEEKPVKKTKETKAKK